MVTHLLIHNVGMVLGNTLQEEFDANVDATAFTDLKMDHTNWLVFEGVKFNDDDEMTTMNVYWANEVDKEKVHYTLKNHSLAKLKLKGAVEQISHNNNEIGDADDIRIFLKNKTKDNDEFKELQDKAYAKVKELNADAIKIVPRYLWPFILQYIDDLEFMDSSGKAIDSISLLERRNAIIDLVKDENVCVNLREVLTGAIGALKGGKKKFKFYLTFKQGAAEKKTEIMEVDITDDDNFTLTGVDVLDDPVFKTRKKHTTTKTKPKTKPKPKTETGEKKSSSKELGASKSKLSKGTIALLVILAVLGLAVIGGLVYYYLVVMKQNPKKMSMENK